MTMCFCIPSFCIACFKKDKFFIWGWTLETRVSVSGLHSQPDIFFGRTTVRTWRWVCLSPQTLSSHFCIFCPCVKILCHLGLNFFFSGCFRWFTPLVWWTETSPWLDITSSSRWTRKLPAIAASPWGMSQVSVRAFMQPRWWQQNLNFDFFRSGKVNAIICEWKLPVGGAGAANLLGNGIVIQQLAIL